MPVIYIDVLFFINFIMDSGLLLVTARLSGKEINILRIIAGGIIGGIYSCSIFFCNLPFLADLPIKLLVSAVMIFVAISAKEIWRILINFYLQSFLLGGVLSAVFYISGRPAVMSNGIYYFPFSAGRLLGLSLPLIIVLAYTYKKSKNRLLSYGKYCTVTISRQGKTVTVDGFFDSGCSLKEPLLDKPVIILNFRYFGQFFDSEKTELFLADQKTELLLSGNFYIIPYSTVSSRDNCMIGFCPDECVVTVEKGSFSCDCVIAFSQAFSYGRAIVNPDVAENKKYFGGKGYEL